MRNVWIGAIAAFAMAAPAIAGNARTGEKVLSVLTHQVDVSVTEDTFTCFFTPGRSGSYVPYDMAWANLQIQADHVTVFPHTEAYQRVTDGPIFGGPTSDLSASELCPRVQQIIREAAATGSVLRVNRKTTLSISTWPTYLGCSRVLTEKAELAFPHGLLLVSYNQRSLSDSSDPADCR